jgi:hypothetical protein
MNANHSKGIPGDFAPESRVWIYQSPRPFSQAEAQEIEKMLQEFVTGWKSHGTPVKGFANLLYGQFIILMADESASGVSGCSTDSSVRLIKTVEQRFGVSLFDRLTLAFQPKEKIEMIPLAQLPYALEKGFIGADTPYFNNLVQTKAELEAKWLIPLKDSWLAARYLKPA